MIKFSRPILFILFAASLFLLGIAISNIVINGFQKGKDLFIQIANLVIYSSAGYTFYIKLYKTKK
jgi:hypothetical protein